MAASVASIAGNVILSVSLVGLMGFQGLALATSLAAIGNGGLLIVLLRHHLHGIHGRHLAMVMMKVLTAGAAMGVAAWGIQYMMATWVPGDRVAAQCAQVGAAIAGGLAVLAAAAKLLGIREFDDALTIVAGRFSAGRESGA